nr:MAG TPA: ParB protein [Caudoviricetes sp.]
MDIWQVKYVRIGDLIPNAKNPRKISKEKLERLQDKIQRLGFHNPVKTDENLNVLGGNQRLKALLKIAGKDLEIPVMYPTRPLTQAEKDEIVITDNISDGEWDWDILTADWDKVLTTSWGLDWGEVETAAEETPQELSEKYTLKITTPIYEVKGDKPDISELVDVVKTNAMLDEINAADGIPEDVKGFLRIAAARLYRFNYEKIAEYYAHQPPEIQAIMEKLALVIIDFNKAIENGYVRLTKEIEGLLDDESDE